MKNIIEVYDIDLAVPSCYGSNILHEVAGYPSSSSSDSLLSLVAPYGPEVNAKKRLDPITEDVGG